MRYLAVALLLFGAACGDDDPLELDAGRSDAGNPDGGADAGSGDGNEDFASAQPVTLGLPATASTIDTAEDVDFFSFEGTAGQWIAAGVTSDFPVFISLHGPDEMKIAEGPPLNDGEVLAADNFPLGLGRFSAVTATRLRADGTHYVRASSLDDASGDFTITLIDMATEETFAIDAEGSDDASSATSLTVRRDVLGGALSSEIGFAVGTFRDAADVDVFAFTVSDTAMGQREISLTPAPPIDIGSTTWPGELWITDAAQTTVLGRVDLSTPTRGVLGPQPEADTRRLWVPSDPGDYLLWVAHPGETADADDIYIVTMSAQLGNPGEESDDSANGARTGAESLLLEAATLGFARSELPVSDIDYWGFDVAAGEDVDVYCSSRVHGSGVEDLQVELRDSTDAVVASATENATSNARIEAFTPAAPGMFFVSLSRGASQLPGSDGNFVRCFVQHATP